MRKEGVIGDLPPEHVTKEAKKDKRKKRKERSSPSKTEDERKRRNFLN
jgi:hypothetical protein